MFNSKNNDKSTFNSYGESFNDLDIPLEDRPVSYFKIGEKIELKGGYFRIKNVGNKFIVLESLPGTKWELIE